MGSYWVIRCYTGSCRVYRNRLRCYIIRDWLLITWEGGGGYKMGGGEAREVLPLRKRGEEKVLAMLKGGHKKFGGSFYAVA